MRMLTERSESEDLEGVARPTHYYTIFGELLGPLLCHIWEVARPTILPYLGSCHARYFAAGQGVCLRALPYLY